MSPRGNQKQQNTDTPLSNQPLLVSSQVKTSIKFQETDIKTCPLVLSCLKMMILEFDKLKS
jgi:hypothetical protein